MNHHKTFKSVLKILLTLSHHLNKLILTKENKAKHFQKRSTMLTSMGVQTIEKNKFKGHISVKLHKFFLFFCV